MCPSRRIPLASYHILRRNDALTREILAHHDALDVHERQRMPNKPTKEAKPEKLDKTSACGEQRVAWAEETKEGQKEEADKDFDAVLSPEARVHKARFSFIVLGYSDTHYTCTYSSGVSWVFFFRLCPASLCVFLTGESVVMVRKSILAGVAVIFWSNKRLQVALGMLILFFFGLLQLKHQPFRAVV